MTSASIPSRCPSKRRSGESPRWWRPTTKFMHQDSEWLFRRPPSRARARDASPEAPASPRSRTERIVVLLVQAQLWAGPIGSFEASALPADRQSRQDAFRSSRTPASAGRAVRSGQRFRATAPPHRAVALPDAPICAASHSGRAVDRDGGLVCGSRWSSTGVAGPLDSS